MARTPVTEDAHATAQELLARAAEDRKEQLELERARGDAAPKAGV